MNIVDLNVGESMRIDNYIITIQKASEEVGEDEVEILIEDVRDFEDEEIC